MRFFSLVTLCGLMLCAGTRPALAATTPKPAKASPSVGLEAAKTVSMITGVAISPLLGIGGVGAYKWWNTAAEQRGSLPWFARPAFWIPALLLVLVVALKDILGTAAPTALKKPFDAAEAVENKISGLIAAGLFVPLIISIFPESGSDGPQSSLAGLGFAAISFSGVGNALLVPFGIIAFVLVWLTSHAINMLILISPFTIVDTALKSVRIALLSLLVGVSFANPYLGAVFSVGIIILAYFLAGWSLRLTVFGTLYMWDLFTFRRCRFQPGAEANWMFTAGKMQGAPIRTYGRLRREGPGRLVFEYRPWLLLAKRIFVLPEGKYHVGRGIFYSEIAREEGDSIQPQFILPPRYATHEEAVARVYGLTDVRDAGLVKGAKATWNWLADLFKGPPAVSPARGGAALQ